ncbi:MAG: signal peptidase II [Gammaproteobacteria bacterium HGW-Gammaproteobacteria-3]|nr:MAG: signal peptidase II [Gammaproteobacteria bacterium HGW-Gammaproteobacteria-3]
MLKWLWLSFVAILLDQISKLTIAGTMRLYESIQVLPFFNLTYVHNTGAAFSFLSQAGGWQRWFFAALAFAISVVITVWLARLKKHEKLLAAALALVLGGAVGNLIDRLAYGYVIDFLDVYLHDWHWPAFNIADSAITLGVTLMLIESFAASKTQSGEK